MTLYSVTIVSEPGANVTWASGVDKVETLRTVAQLLDRMSSDPAVWSGDVIITRDVSARNEAEAAPPCL